MSVPNQKNITLSKSEKYKSLENGDVLVIRSREAERLAAKLLKDTAFKVWLYITGNKNEYNFDLSSADVISAYGISRRSYSSALKELEEVGYLVPKEQGGTRYYWFYDFPQKTENNTINIERQPADVLQTQLSDLL